MSFMRLIDPGRDLSQAMHANHDPALVAGSVFVAVLAAYAAMSLADQMRAAHSRASAKLWLGVGAIAMGVGVWAMHFTAMLAHFLPVPVRYDSVITVLSALPSILAAAVALAIISRDHIT